MRIHTAILSTVFCLLLASLVAARPDEPKKEATPATPAANAAKAAEPGAAVVDLHSEEHLRNRVDQFWRSKVATKYDECYNLLTKKSKEKQTLVNYIQRINTRTTGYRIDSVTPDPASPDHVKVVVYYKLQALGYKIDNAKQFQDWYFEDGDWYAEYVARTPFDSKSHKPTAEKTAEAAKAAAEGAGGKSEESDLDPEQKKHVKEMVEQLRKKYGSAKPSLNEAMAPQEKAGKTEAKPAATAEKPSSAESQAVPADSSKKSAPEKKATGYQTKPRHSTSKTDPSGNAQKEQESSKSGAPAETSTKQDPAKTGTPAGTPAKQDPAKTGTPAETPTKKDPAQTGGDPK